MSTQDQLAHKNKSVTLKKYQPRIICDQRKAQIQKTDSATTLLHTAVTCELENHPLRRSLFEVCQKNNLKHFTLKKVHKTSFHFQGWRMAGAQERVKFTAPLDGISSLVCGDIWHLKALNEMTQPSLTAFNSTSHNSFCGNSLLLLTNSWRGAWTAWKVMELYLSG